MLHTLLALWLQRNATVVLILLSLGFSASVRAHNSPADLAQMSLEDLMQVRVDDLALAQTSWELSFKTITRVQDGLANGSQSLAIDDVLWDRSQPRTAYNFPIVGFRVEQEAKQFTLSRRFEEYRFSTSVSHLKQSTDHVSIIPGYERFTITTSGISDWQLQLTRQFSRKLNQGFDVSVGISLPTGSIDEKGDTPRGPGNQIVPYNMQLGSGTFDFPVAVVWRDQFWDLSWGLSGDYRLRTGRNDRDYRLGNTGSLKAWSSYRFADMKASIILGYQHRAAITGQDETLLMVNPTGFNFPVTKANPRFYGGEQTKVQFGLSRQIRLRDSFIHIDGSYTSIINEHLNGIQPPEQDRYSLGISFLF